MIEVRQLTEAELNAFYSVRSIAYPGSDLGEEELKRSLRSRLQYSRGLFVAGRLASVATMWPSSMYLNGSAVNMGALAGVATAPEFRRAGHVRTLLLDELRRLSRAGTGWCLEFPFDPAFYHRLGWQSIPLGSELEIPCRYLLQGPPPPSARRLQLSEFATLAPIYRGWASRYTFPLTREDDPRAPWTRITSKEWLEEDGFLYAFDGAYLLFTLTRENQRSLLNVEDYAYVDGLARERILTFIGSLDGQVEVVRIFLPDDDPVSLDHRSKHAKAGRWSPQVRIADLRAALGPFSSNSRKSITVRVHDELCAWNDGTFAITIGPDGTSVCAGQDPAEAELPIQTLPLLLVGAVTPAAAVAQGRAAGDLGALEALASLSSGRTPFMPLSDAF